MVAWRRHWNWAEAERYLRASIAIGKSEARPRVYYAWVLRAAGRVSHADAEMSRALDLDPVSSFVSANAGLILYFSRRYSEAIAHLRETLILDEHYALAHLPLDWRTRRAANRIKQSRLSAGRLGSREKARDFIGPFSVTRMPPITASTCHQTSIHAPTIVRWYISVSAKSAHRSIAWNLHCESSPATSPTSVPILCSTAFGAKSASATSRNPSACRDLRSR